MSEEYQRGLHPDADVLNAFLEGVLPEHERAECLTHLADCAQCREIVFLAREAAETEEPALVKEAAPFWRKLLRPAPALAVAAMAILVFLPVALYRIIRPAEQKPRLIASAEPAAPAPEGGPQPARGFSPAPPTGLDAPRGLKSALQAAPAISPPTAPQRARNTVAQPGTAPSLPALTGGAATVEPAPEKTSPTSVLQEQAQARAAAAAPPPPLPAAPPTTASLTPRPEPVVVPAAPHAPAQFATALRAPVATGAGVAGTITDPAGAVIAQAQVELKNDETGATYTSASNARGQFSIAGLAPGRYDLSVTSTGFQKFMRPSIELQPQTIASIDPKLDIGTATETVTVTAETSVLKTESAAVAKTRKVPAAELPLSRSKTGADVRTEPVYQLPNKKPAVTFAAKDRLVVAANAEGALFFSENQGKSWKQIKGKWKGKVMRVVSPSSAPGDTNAVFELITDPPSTWVSADGRNWTAAPASR